jgi:hypothetical protein
MFYYVISSGECSDEYGVVGFYMSEQYLDSAKFKEMWLEAIKRNSDYNNKELEKFIDYFHLDKGKCQFIYDIHREVGFIEYMKAAKELHYEPRYNLDFYAEVLKENGLKEVSYEEHNVEYFQNKEEL